MKRPSLSFMIAILLVLPPLACGGAGGAASADGSAAEPVPPPSSVRQGVFTTQQAQRGRQVFRDTCSECHSTRDFRGETFFLSFEGVTLGRFVDGLVETMPDGDPGSLPMQQYLDVTAYILELNGFPQGPAELPDEASRLAAIRIERMAPGAQPPEAR